MTSQEAADKEKAEGVKCYRSSDFDGAIYHFSESLKHGPLDPAQVLGNRAAAFEKIGDFEAAATDARDALTANPDYLKGYFRLATSLVELQRYDEAIAATEEGLRKQPRNSQLIELRDKARVEKRLADARSAGGREEEEDEEDEDDEDDEEEESEEEDEAEPMQASPYARASAASADARPPAERAEAAKAAGNVEYKAARYEAAIRLYGDAVRLMPSNATYLINRAAAHLMVQQADEALADCHTALSHEPNLVKAHVRAAKALTQLGRLSDARRQLELGQTFDASDAALQSELATLAELEGALRSAKSTLQTEGGPAAREALRLYTLLVERCPCAPAIACAQMEALLRARPEQGPSQVIGESARWLRKYADNPDLLCVRGKGLYQSGQVEAGLKHFTEALRLDPDHSASRKMRQKVKELERAKEAGKEAFQAGKYKEATELYTAALEVDPDNKEVAVTLYTNRATAKFKCDDFKGCIEDCNLALGVQPRHLKALLRRAACHMELEDWKKAISDYESAHDIDSDDNGIKQQLRNAKIEQKKAGRKCLYKMLGTTRKATDHEIKKAYKKMALQFHPDRHAGASDEEKAEMEIKFKEIGEAFEVLSDPQKKQRWDQGETLDEINGNGGGGGRRGGGGMDPSDIFRMYAQQGGGGMPRGFGGF